MVRHLVPLRIGFDLDGVLADMETALVRQAEILFGQPVPARVDGQAAAESSPAADDDRLDRDDAPADAVPPLLKRTMTARQQRRLWQHVAAVENFWETLAEIEPGAIERLAATARERRWEIIFLTKRPQTAGATAQLQSQRWLESRGFTLPSVYVVHRSRGRIAAALSLDIVVDDRPENCLDVVVDSKARALLVWRGDKDLLPASARRVGIGVVKTVGECLDILAQMDLVNTGEPAGVMNRVKRLLGLKESAGA
jgi:hypothetical protein